MNTLEVTYADKAGRLIEQSPDKKDIENLKTKVDALIASGAKIYEISKSPDALATEEISDIVNNGYNIIKEHYDGIEDFYYLVSYSSNAELDFYTISSEVFSKYHSDYDGEEWSEPTLTNINIGGTKLYKHIYKITVADTEYTFTFINNISTPYTVLQTIINDQATILSLKLFYSGISLGSCYVNSMNQIYGFGSSGVASLSLSSPILYNAGTDTVTPL